MSTLPCEGPLFFRNEARSEELVVILPIIGSRAPLRVEVAMYGSRDAPTAAAVESDC